MSRATWPTNMTIGVESCCAMWMPGEALVAPGPRVTKQTPGRPVALPTASAIMAAPPSWRQTVTAMSLSMKCIKRREIALARHAKDVLHAVNAQLIDQNLGGGAVVILAAHDVLLGGFRRACQRRGPHKCTIESKSANVRAKRTFDFHGGSGRGSQDEVLAFLADPATHGGHEVRRIDTHASSVFLTEDRALKVKRAVRFPFLDYSTLEKRKAACEAELAVNAPYAPEIYRGVVPITREAGGELAIGGAGQPVEWALEMERFDENRTLDRLPGGVDEALADALGRAVAAAHARASRSTRSRGSKRSAPISTNMSRRSGSTRDIFPRGGNRHARAAEPRRISAHPAVFARARTAGVRTPHPRRPSSRQHRADRRQAGSVRRHRVQRHHRFRRCFLRSRISADGPHWSAALAPPANIVLNRYLAETRPH